MVVRSRNEPWRGTLKWSLNAPPTQKMKGHPRIRDGAQAYLVLRIGHKFRTMSLIILQSCIKSHKQLSSDVQSTLMGSTRRRVARSNLMTWCLRDRTWRSAPKFGVKVIDSWWSRFKARILILSLRPIRQTRYAQKHSKSMRKIMCLPLHKFGAVFSQWVHLAPIWGAPM